jgi:hypothetical protein
MTQPTDKQSIKRRRHRAWYRLRRRQDNTETTKVYTEQEIQSLSRVSSNNVGIIRPGTADLHMPSDLVDGTDGKHSNGLPTVLFVIITLAVIFIAIIAHFVSLMPEKP